MTISYHIKTLSNLVSKLAHPMKRFIFNPDAHRCHFTWFPTHWHGLMSSCPHESNQTHHSLESIRLTITPISAALKCFVLLSLVPKNSIWCDFQRGNVHVEIWKHSCFCVWNQTSLWCVLAATSMACNCWNKLPVKAAAVVRSRTTWPNFIYQLTYSHGMMEICHHDIIWHVSDRSFHTVCFLEPLQSKLLLFIAQSKHLDVIFVADEHLLLIVWSLELIMSPSFTLSFSLAFSFSVKTHGCGRRAEGRGGAWAQTQDIRRPGLSSYSFSLWISPGPFCPCLSIYVHAGMCLCLFALPVWTLYRTAVLFSVGQITDLIHLRKSSTEGSILMLNAGL